VSGQFNYSGRGLGTDDGWEVVDFERWFEPAQVSRPVGFSRRKTINVLDGKLRLTNLNELEFVQGEIYANVWHDNRIATIDPQSGRVTAWIDLNGLMPEGRATGSGSGVEWHCLRSGEQQALRHRQALAATV
jgi:glutamine cyclotransferase